MCILKYIFKEDVDGVLTQFNVNIKAPTKNEVDYEFNKISGNGTNVTKIMADEKARNLKELITHLHLDRKLQKYLYKIITELGESVINFVDNDKGIHIRTVRNTKNEILKIFTSLTNLYII